MKRFVEFDRLRIVFPTQHRQLAIRLQPPIVPGILPQMLAYGVTGNRPQPGAEVSACLKVGQVHERIDKDLLDKIFRLIPVVKGRRDNPQHIPLVTAHNLLEVIRTPNPDEPDKFVRRQVVYRVWIACRHRFVTSEYAALREV